MSEAQLKEYGLQMIVKDGEVDPYETILATLQKTAPEALPVVELLMERNKLLEERVRQTEDLLQKIARPDLAIPETAEEIDEKTPIVTGYRYGKQAINLEKDALITVLREDGTDQGWFHGEFMDGQLLQIADVNYFVPNSIRVYVPKIVREIFEQRDSDLEGVRAKQRMLDGKHEYGAIVLG